MKPEQLVESIFGGPPVKPCELEKFFVEAGIHFPTQVVAVPSGTSGPRQAVLLSLHPGLDYWFSPVKKGKKDSTCCDSVSDVVRAIQQAVLAARREELRRAPHSSPRFISEMAEAQAFHLALQEVRENPGKPSAGLDVWIEIVMKRHQSIINEIRRRFVEFIAALTRGVDTLLAYPFYSGIRRIYSTYQLRELADVCRAVSQELGLLIAGRKAHHPAGIARSEAVWKAFNFMERHFDEGISLLETANAAHVSAPHLARLFRAETGKTVVEYLQLLRITRAKELLSTTDKATLEVALDSGFESVEHFHRLFKRLVGTTPKAYRISTRD